MAKRFTDTEKWKMAWYRKLGSQGRDLWNYLHENCDNAGILEIDLERMTFELGFEVNFEMIKNVLKNKYISIKQDRIFLTEFVKFQYGELEAKSNPHKSIIKKLKNERVWEGYVKGIYTLEDKEQDKDKEKNKEQDKENADKFSTNLSSDDVLAFFDLWNFKCGDFSPADSLTSDRIEKIRAIIAELPLAEWSKVFDEVAASDFLKGLNSDWRADLDWVIQNPENYKKILAGNYKNKPKSKNLNTSLLIKKAIRDFGAARAPEAKIFLGPEIWSVVGLAGGWTTLCRSSESDKIWTSQIFNSRCG